MMTSTAAWLAVSFITFHLLVVVLHPNNKNVLGVVFVSRFAFYLVRLPCEIPQFHFDSRPESIGKRHHRLQSQEPELQPMPNWIQFLKY